VNPIARALLALLGIAVFLLAWEAIVLGTRPAPVRRPALGFSSVREGRTAVALLDADGRLVAHEVLALDASATSAAAATLRLWLGSIQPTLAALPPGAAGSGIEALLDAARRDYGGALESSVVPVAGGSGAAEEATRRARMLQDRTSLRPAWLPEPGEAFAALAQMAASGELLRHVVASVFRVATGFAIAVALGIPFGLVLGASAWLSALANSVIQCLRPISPIAWLPVATLALGGGDVAAVFLIFLASFFPITVSTAAAVATVDVKYRRAALNFGVRGFAMARRVVLPAALPSILTALRIALGISWVVVVAAEMLGVESGLGFLVLDARNQLRYDRVVAAMIVIGMIGLVIDLSVRRFEREELRRRGLAAR